MIVSANGSSKDKEAILERLEEFIEMADNEEEEIHFSVSFGQADEAKFRVSNAINGLEEFRDNHSELLEKYNIHHAAGSQLEDLRQLSWALDEDEVPAK